MATTVLTPVVAYGAAPLANVGTSATVWSTTTVSVGGFQADLDFQCVMGSVMSLNPEIRAFKSKDGGATFDTFPYPFAMRQIQRNTSATDRLTLTLPTGVYALACCPGSPNTATVGIGTYAILTAVQAVG